MPHFEIRIAISLSIPELTMAVVKAFALLVLACSGIILLGLLVAARVLLVLLVGIATLMSPLLYVPRLWITIVVCSCFVF